LKISLRIYTEFFYTKSVKRMTELTVKIAISDNQIIDLMLSPIST